MMAPRLLLIYTGGTIGMVRNEATGALKALDFSHLKTHIPEIESLGVRLDFTSFETPIDSSYMQTSHWIDLAGIINRNYHIYDGFVILHGSDTMAYTASALSFMLENLAKPVIITGAQLPIGILRSDARENLITSIEIAATKTDQGAPMVPEVCVYFEFNLYRGNRVFKYSTQDFDAFKSPNYPTLAEVGVQVKFKQRYIAKAAIAPLEVHTALCTDIAIFHLFPGVPDAQFRALLSIPSLRAVIIQTYGSGNTHATKSFVSLLEKAQSAGVAIINVSQCKAGFVEMGKYESSSHLQVVQTISAGDMTLEATLAKAMYLLGKGFTGFTLKEFMEKDLRGEISSLQ